MYKVIFEEDFVFDLEKAILYYTKINPRLAINLFFEIKNSEKIIGSFPEIFRLRHKDLRRYNLETFPYLVFYRIKNESIQFLRLLHQSSDPVMWP